MEELEIPETPYLTTVTKEIIELNITQEYETALIDCVNNLFSPDQLNYSKNEFNKKIIFAERDLLLTRIHATQADLLAFDVYSLEKRILFIYRQYISAIL